MTTASQAGIIAFADAAQFEAWLDQHVDLQAGVWLKIAKKDSGIPSLTGEEAVDSGLCYGGISGQRQSFDASCYLQKYVPRRPRSLWSQVNVDKVERLAASGRMRPWAWSRSKPPVLAPESPGTCCNHFTGEPPHRLKGLRRR